MPKKKKTKKSAPKPPPPKASEATPDTVFVLRTCAKDMTSRDGRFTWPTSGPVEAPDWKPTKECGNGLHGFLKGEGHGTLASWAEDAKWLVVEVNAADIINLDGKVKFPRGVVRFVGDRAAAVAMIVERHPEVALSIIGGQATASGYGGQATASGVRGQATASGVRGQATASGVGGQATASGDGGQATASGDGGQATASGVRGQATASGVKGRADGGLNGYARAAEKGLLTIAWWDEPNDRCRLAVAYVGEDGIKPKTTYRFDIPTKQFVEVPT